MAETTDFRNAVRDLVAEAAGISMLGDRPVDGPVEDVDLVVAWPEGWIPNEENRQFRRFTVTVRVLVAHDPAVVALDDSSAVMLEDLAEKILAAVPAGLLDGKWFVQVDAVGMDVAQNAIEFSFTAELDNPAEV